MDFDRCKYVKNRQSLQIHHRWSEAIVSSMDEVAAQNEWWRRSIVYESSEVDRGTNEDQTNKDQSSKNIFCKMCLFDFIIVLCDVSIKGGC
jgi:hypothetical protein